MKTHVAVLQGTKLQNSTQYDEFENTNENTTTRATNEDKFSKNTKVGMSPDSMQGRGGGKGKTKGGEDH